MMKMLGKKFHADRSVGERIVKKVEKIITKNFIVLSAEMAMVEWPHRSTIRKTIRK